jgi:hypothetical protein
MGATTFYNKVTAPSMKEGYNLLIEQAIDECGNDPYNGTISTTFTFTDATNKYKASGKDLNQFIDDAYDYLGKRDCWAICVKEPKGNSNKIKSQVELNPQIGKRVWETRYEVRTSERLVASHILQGEAIKMARDYTERTKINTTVNITKHLVEGNTQVAKIEYKKSKDECDGDYVFFGYAAE